MPIYDRSQTIVNSVKDVQETLFIAFVLVVMVIFLFLGRATDTLIPAGRAAAVAAADVHRDAHAGLQPRQPFADGVDAGDRVPRR